MSEESNVSTQDAPVEASEEVQNEQNSPQQEAGAQSEEQGEQLAGMSETQKDDAKEKLKAMSKTLKLKVDGREIEQIVDLNDEEGLKRLLQKGFAAEKRMQEAANKRKEAENLLFLLKTNPGEVMRLMGIDEAAYAEQVLEQKLIEMEMSPEEKERREKDRKLAEYEAKMKEMEAEKRRQEDEAKKREYASSFTSELTEVLKKNPDIPRSDFTVRRIAMEMEKYIKAGYDVPVEFVVNKIKPKLTDETNSLFKEMDDSLLVQYLTKAGVIDRLKAIRKSRAKKTKAVAQADKIVSTAKAPVKEEPKESMSAKEWFRSLK